MQTRVSRPQCRRPPKERSKVGEEETKGIHVEMRCEATSAHLHRISIRPVPHLDPLMIARDDAETLDPAVHVLVQLPRLANERVDRIRQQRHGAVQHTLGMQRATRRVDMDRAVVIEDRHRHGKRVRRRGGGGRRRRRRGGDGSIEWGIGRGGIRLRDGRGGAGHSGQEASEAREEMNHHPGH